MSDDKKEYGEGNYKAAREYQSEEHEFAKDKDRVKEKAREAADALDSEEGAELEKARKDSADGPN